MRSGARTISVRWLLTSMVAGSHGCGAWCIKSYYRLGLLERDGGRPVAPVDCLTVDHLEPSGGGIPAVMGLDVAATSAADSDLQCRVGEQASDVRRELGRTLRQE